MEYRYMVIPTADSGDEPAGVYLQTIPIGTSEDGSAETAHFALKAPI
ncbi:MULTISPECIES: hypothetical protein [unclassified Microcoleus]